MMVLASLLLVGRVYQSGNDWNRAKARLVIVTVRPCSSHACAVETGRRIAVAVIVIAGRSGASTVAGRPALNPSVRKARCTRPPPPPVMVMAGSADE